MMTEAELRTLLIEHGLGRVADFVIQSSQPTIRLVAVGVEDEAMLPLGASKFGGSPDVPLGFEWPLHDGFPLTFIAQVNMADAAPYDSAQQLPPTGLLSFFLDLDNWYSRIWKHRRVDGTFPDFENKYFDPGNVYVCFYDGHESNLNRAEMPDLRPIPRDGAGPFKACGITFSHGLSVSDARTIEDQFSLSDGEFAAYIEVEGQVNERAPWSETSSQMLGLPGIIQGEREYLRDGEVLLLQMSSECRDFDEHFGWGDGGALYFFIAADALVRCDFRAIRFDEEFG